MGIVEGDAAQGEASVDRAELAFGHLAGGCEQHYEGRTPDVARFMAGCQEVSSSDEQSVTLRVHYNWTEAQGDAKTATGCIEYLRSDGAKGPMERERKGDEPPAEWRPLHFSYKLGTYLSSVMMNTEGEPRPCQTKFISG